MILTTDRLLAATDVNVDAFALCEVARDVCLVTPPVTAIEVHLVLAGTLYFSVPGSAPLTLHQGAVVVTPAGIPQRLAATLTPTYEVDAIAVCAPHPNGMMLFDATETGTGDLRILCGKVRAQIAGSVGTLDSVTAPIAAELGDSPFVRGAFEAMAAETSAGAVGARVIVSALMKAVLAVLLRQHLANTAPAPSLLAQPQLARAVAEVVTNPATPHSVASLACVAGMSRSAFAKSFADALGVSPMQFVSRTRMALARDLLAGSGLPIAAIAAHVGVTSRSHFSRLFRISYGVDPTTFRRRLQSGESCLAD